MFAVKKLATVAIAAASLGIAGCAAQGQGSAAKDVDTLSQLKADPAAALQTASSKTGPRNMSIVADGTVAGQPLKSSGEVSYGGATRAHLTMQIAGRQAEVRLIGTTEYVQLPSAQQGKHWMKVDLLEVAKTAGLDSAEVSEQLSNMDPAKQVKALLASKRIKAVGVETIGGVRVVHYSGTLTASQYVDAYAAAGKRDQLEKSLKSAGIDSLTSDVWMDESYGVRKAVMKGGPMDLSYSYTPITTPVTVEAPPASDTLDVLELLKRMQHVPA